MMKSIFIFLLLIVSTGTMIDSRAQQVVSKPLKSCPLQINGTRTVSLIFSATVEEIDIGNPSQVMAARYEKADNIVRVRAKQGVAKGFQESTLSVITADGRFYNFVVTYTDKPETLSFQVSPADFSGSTEKTIQEPGKPQVALLGSSLNSSQLTYYSTQVAYKKGSIKKQVTGQVQLVLGRFYIKNGVIFCQLRLKNSSRISYDVDLVRWFIRDEDAARRTASQQVDLKPLHVYSPSGHSVAAEKKLYQVYSFEKFTLAPGKVLVLQVQEKQGGRHFEIAVPSELLLARVRQL